MAVSPRKNAGFTLVELLVVITILGVLMSLLIPAVNSVRESARRAQCKSNLSNLGKAARLHLTAQGWFPSNGWGHNYQGDPDHGFGGLQPGGWIYNILPYMGLDMIHDIGKGLSAQAKLSSSPGGLWEAEAAPIPGVICPTRRKVQGYPISGSTELNAAVPTQTNKTDYAVNSGTNVIGGINGGPPFSPSTGLCTNYPNCVWSNPDQSGFTGVSGERSQVTQIPDGESNVFLAGEKYLNPNAYYTATVWTITATTPGAFGDAGSCLEGHDNAIARWVSQVPGVGAGLSYPNYFVPLRDAAIVPSVISGPTSYFGSAHPAGVNFVFCDGSVKLVSYLVDPPTYQSLGGRNDGTVAELPWE